MRKYLGPILVIALALIVAGAWVLFPQARTSVRSAVSGFCSSFAAAAKDGLARLMAKNADDSTPEVPPSDWGNDDDSLLEIAELRTTQNPEPRGPSQANPDDPDPSTLTPAQRRQKYNELIAAAKARRLEVMRFHLMKSAEGRDALNATRAYYAKLKEMKDLEKKHGQLDDSVAAVRFELIALREKLRDANARYRAWKVAHPSSVVDPHGDKLYRELISRSRPYLD